MKSRMMLVVFCLCLGNAFAAADTVYENGPVSGDYIAWRIDNSNAVSNSFTVSGGNSTINGLSVWVDIFMTDHNPSAEVVISSQSEGGGTVYFDQMEQFSSETNCYADLWGFNLCQETATWTGGPTLPNGTYWVTLRHGSVPSGGIFGWDENFGFACHSTGCPSQAFAHGVGTIPSEAFTILGTSGDNKDSPPKTTGLLMFGTGFFGLVGIVRQTLS